MVGCAILRLASGKINIAFTGIADAAFRDKGAENVLTSPQLDNAGIEAAVHNSSVNSANVMGDHFASAEYRRHLAIVYLKKALSAVL